MAVSPGARDEELFVLCRSCGFPVASGIRIGADELPEAELPARDHRCPRCGRAHVYERADYFHRE